MRPFLPVLLILLLQAGCLELGTRPTGEPDGDATKSLNFTLDGMGLSNGGGMLTLYPTADQSFVAHAKWDFDVALPDDSFADLELPCFAWSIGAMLRVEAYAPPAAAGSYLRTMGTSEDARVALAGLGVEFGHVHSTNVSAEPVHLLVGGKNLDTPEYSREATFTINSSRPFTYEWEEISFDCAEDISDLTGGTIVASDETIQITDAAWSVEGTPGTLMGLQVFSDIDHQVVVDMGDSTSIQRSGPVGAPAGGVHLLYEPRADHATVNIQKFTSGAGSRLLLYGFTGVPEDVVQPLIDASAESSQA